MPRIRGSLTSAQPSLGVSSVGGGTVVKALVPPGIMRFAEDRMTREGSPFTVKPTGTGREAVPGAGSRGGADCGGFVRLRATYDFAHLPRYGIGPISARARRIG